MFDNLTTKFLVKNFTGEKIIKNIIVQHRKKNKKK